jgi:hypothetical protein
MKKLMLLAVLTLAPVLDGKSFAFSNQAAAAGVSRERPGARPEQEYGSDHQINALAEKYHSNEKRLLPAAGPINEIEAKRLKLVFLLMMSLGQYRAPVQ